ncbi:SwmB domain-containing protein [Acinetobacter terrestris]|uniref:SwmB domain-containing protein n=1 Tax=Acinetobacter terrestris TaxID=2529843 RepID=A0AAW6UV83_9GAMM|nr:SwmB domain-containing protein [Acinetobacter terrestris]MDK1683050.1 SwmB domain-containing protein [Acinetobacter terrestris]
MATIKILSAQNGEVLQNIDNNIVKLTQNSVIQVNADIDEVVTITRQGNSAVIQLKNGESIIIENYFDYPVDANRIVFENEGKLYWAEFTDQNGEMLDTILYHPLTEGTVESTNMAAGILPWLGGALAIGAIAAAAGSGGSSGGDSDSGSRDNTPPKLTGIIVNENGQLELSFNENVNGSNPRPEDFTVIVDGEEIPVTNIIVEGDKITLVTEPAIQDGQDVTIDYQDSTPNNDQGIKDSEGNVLDGLDSDAVGGVKNPDTTAPTLLSAEVNENGNIELSFNEALDADNLPPATSLVVTVGTAPNQTAINVIDTIADGNILILITDPVISAGQSVNVVYTDPSAGNDLDAIQDIAGNDAAGFDTADLPNGVVNNSDQQDPDVDAPVLIDAEVNENGNIELSFNEDVSGSNPLNDDFTVTVDGTAVSVTEILINGSIITLITDPEITQGQVVEVSYSDSTPENTQGIQDSDGNVLEGFDAVDVGGVENNSELQTPDVDAPVLIDAEVNENGNIELSFNEDVSSSNPLNDDFTVTVDGTVVPVKDLIINGSIITLITDPEITQGQVVEVSYSDSTPGNTQGIQDSDSNVLEGFDAVDVGGVENNSEQQTPDVDAPVLIEAEANTNGDIELSFNEDISDSNPLATDFTVFVDGVAVSVTGLLSDGNIITLIIDPEIAANQTVEVIYSDSTSGDGQGIKDSTNNVLETFNTAVKVPTFTANPDSVNLDLGGLEANITYPAETENGLVVVGLLNGTDTPDLLEARTNGKTITVEPNALGSIEIEVDQVSLLSLGQAFQVYVMDENGNVVYRAVTADSLIGDVAGIPILGLTNSGALSATVTGLTAGTYYVVVANDESVLAQLINDVTLAELGTDGVVLGPDNQQIVLDAVSDALGPVLGPTVTGLLTPVLGLLDGLGVGQVVEPLVSILNSLNLTNLVDNVLDGIADALLSNILELAKFTELSTQLTESTFINNTVSGNVITGTTLGETADEPIAGSTITQVAGDGTTTIDGNGVITVIGAYGTLTMSSDGNYNYAANLDANVVGQSDVFTYTLSNNGTTTTSTLTINIDDFVADTLSIELLDDTGTSDSDGITSNGLVLVTGSELGAVWEYSTDGGTTWSRGGGDRFTLNQGEYAAGDIQVRQTNFAGNVSVVTLSDKPITVDQNVDFGSYGALDNVGQSQGHIYNNGTTDDQTPTLYGAAEEGAEIELYRNNVLEATIQVDATGQWQYQAPNLAVGPHTWTAVVTDKAGNTTEQDFTLNINTENARPVVAVNNGNLLGLLGGNVAGLIDLNQQRFIVGDANDDLKKVEVAFFTGAGLSLGGGTWTYSEALKDQFGYNVQVATTGLPFFGQTVTATITAIDGSVLDNQEITEFLGTLRTTQSFLNLTVGSSLTVTATDAVGNETLAIVSELLNLSLLGGLLGGTTPSYLKEGTAQGETLDHSNAADGVRIYGYEGNDTLIGGRANDILRGGNGNDILDGGAGNDYLNGGSDNDTITGGVGADTVVFDLLNASDATGGNGVDTWTDFSLSQGDIIDISELLGDEVTGYNLDQYVSLNYDEAAQSITVKIDRDGTGDIYNSTNLLILTNQREDITMDELLMNKSIIF